MGWSTTGLLILLVSVGLISGHTIKDRYGSVPEKPIKCNQGQAYWCQDIKNAVSCNALKHCIQGVWEKEVPIEKDKSEVCQVCLDMVKTARDQLESNETQEDIKAVLDGSCRLIPVKIVRHECIKLMDDFAPQLIDVLASQMDPQVVCSVAGLCDNNRVLQLEQEYYRNINGGHRSEELTCENCNGLMSIVEQKISDSSPESVLHFFVQLCRRAGSYSDACASMFDDHKTEIHKFLLNHIHGGPVCSLAGVCKEKYHSHSKDLVRVPVHISSVNAEVLNTNDDLPCDLCIQLVAHLKDILMSNTTKETFKVVLDAICKQMTVYRDECVAMVDQYYDVVYDFLQHNLDGQFLCKEIEICPSANEDKQELLRPLIFTNSQPSIGKHVGNDDKIELPVELYNPLTFVPSSFVSGTTNKANDKMMCAMCEYFLHFLQQEITLPSTEREIQEIVMKGCNRLPKSVSAQCNSFVETYMDDFIALLANEIDPSQVCPLLHVCPGDLVLVEYNDKPTCPLCLLAMEEIVRKAPNQTEAGVKDIIDDLCMRDIFPNSLSLECVKFITDNRQAIIEMVLAEFTAQESCVYIDVCVVPEQPASVDHHVGNIETNEISDSVESNEVKDNTACVLCEFVMNKVDDYIKQNKTQEEIKNFFLNICKHLPKTITPQCTDFVNQYADLVLTLLEAEMDPKEVCTALGLCGKASSIIEMHMKKCLFCEMLMGGLKAVLTDKEVDYDINKNLERACLYLPESEQSTCVSLIDQIAPQVETALRTLPVGPLICKRINMCSNDHEKDRNFLSLTIGKQNCVQGPTYWCQSTKTAALCERIEYCQKHIWKADKPKRGHNKGQVVIRY